jgi:transcription antitermination factor NusG
MLSRTRVIMRFHQVTVMSRDLDFYEMDQPLGVTPVTEVVERDAPDALKGRQVIVVSGPWKGYRGTIKDTNLHKRTARVELWAGSQLKTVRLSDLAEMW